MKFKPIIILVIVFATNLALASNEVINTQTQNTITQNTAINTTRLGTAKDWGLTESDWIKYIELKQGPAGHYYPQLSPPKILGLYAKDKEEMRHYAEIVAQQEHEKLAHELQFDDEFHQAALRLYPDEPIIKPFDLSPFTPIAKSSSNSIWKIQSGDHLALFVDVNENNSSELTQLIHHVQSNAGSVLDIYCLNVKNTDAIRNWAKSNHIPIDLVSGNRITLNNDNGKFKKTVSSGNLPFVLLVRNGQSKPIDIGSL